MSMKKSHRKRREEKKKKKKSKKKKETFWPSTGFLTDSYDVFLSA